ncbi:YihY/virulence factor BrkB family protein [Sphingomonas morindae]|uniref:YihY/virulence factor BrkB family protein n=1 Tax=Sphingomonas morindae TaxID=1541170 RepID=A0ABY4X3E9_9SPHN|nr:YihY/virulence factor BrkB family protein [Sphingomonas morindae]USI71429.1 YihY/virulence factor BrkB family protein [Sphingomonas morindae]
MSDPVAARRRGRSGWLALVRQVGVGVYSDGFIHAGNIAYLSIISLFPFFIIVTALAQLFGRSGDGHVAIESVLRFLPRSVEDLIRPVVETVLAARTGPLLWLGALVGLWTVGSFIETIRDILRRAYGTRFNAPFWEYRLWSVAIIVGSVAMMFLAFALQVALTAAEQVVDRFFPVAQEVVGWIGLSRLLPGLVLFGALYVLFLALTPSRFRYSKAPKWPGALLTALWWLGVTAALPLVLARFSYDLTYGSLAGVIVALFFFWLVGLGLVTGAHLNAALAKPGEPSVKDAARHEAQ